jgi:uncharacterized protein (DUF736 family)
MRKRIVGHRSTDAGEVGQKWLNLDQVATVEVSSEHPDFAIESAFASENGPGWRASEPGEQQIRIIFDHPVSLRRIKLRFEETESERTQEFRLLWSSASGGRPTEIVRQQWNFSPSGSTSEVEDYSVNLDAVSMLELVIIPDIGSGRPVATLASMRLA